MRLNLHKGYLLELEKAGVPVVPTCLVRRGEPASLAGILAGRGWSGAVIKPAISNASRLTDLALRADGTPQVMELELIEPSLYFPSSEEALERFVRGVRRRL